MFENKTLIRIENLHSVINDEISSYLENKNPAVQPFFYRVSSAVSLLYHKACIEYFSYMLKDKEIEDYSKLNNIKSIMESIHKIITSIDFINNKESKFDKIIKENKLIFENK